MTMYIMDIMFKICLKERTCTSLNIRELTKEQLAEESLIDLAYALLEERKTPIAFKDLLKEIQLLNGLSDEEIQDRLVQFYTDMNIDGRFLLNQENTWGLREWYKIETIEEETAPTVKTRKRKSKALAIDEEDELIDEDDLVFEEDLEEFVEEDIEEEDIDEEDIEFVDEELDIDAEIDDVDVDDEIIEDDEGFIIEDDELEDEEEDEEEDK